MSSPGHNELQHKDCQPRQLRSWLKLLVHGPNGTPRGISRPPQERRGRHKSPVCISHRCCIPESRRVNLRADVPRSYSQFPAPRRPPDHPAWGYPLTVPSAPQHSTTDAGSIGGRPGWRTPIVSSFGDGWGTRMALRLPRPSASHPWRAASPVKSCHKEPAGSVIPAPPSSIRPVPSAPSS